MPENVIVQAERPLAAIRESANFLPLAMAGHSANNSMTMARLLSVMDAQGCFSKSHGRSSLIFHEKECRKILSQRLFVEYNGGALESKRSLSTLKH